MSNTRWEQLLRYRFIEIVAMWEGRLTTRHLCDVFGIGRQQASKDINNYKRSIGPGNLEYDPIARATDPAPTSHPKSAGERQRNTWKSSQVSATCSSYSANCPTPSQHRGPDRTAPTHPTIILRPYCRPREIIGA